MAKKPERPAASLANLRPGNRRGPAKTSLALKEAILAAAADVGEDGAGRDGMLGYLRMVAREDVKAFTGLLGKVLPLQLQGDKDSPLVPGLSAVDALLGAIGGIAARLDPPEDAE